MEKNSEESDALDAVATARRRLAERLYTPWWYHPVLGLLLGTLVLQLGGVLGRPAMFLIPVPVLGIIVLGRIYRRLSGIDLYGDEALDGGQSGRSLLAIYVSGITICFAAGFLLGNQLGIAWTPWVIAAILVVGTVVVGRRYDGLLRTQLRSAAP
ncbi:hypothetical protein I2485_00545 [Nesterenkonia sp. E16_7]|uniref:hypothetical protein n=1 Tax=unclassified Nesterenkonia TaxID=2629769 RepID=UPI001A923FF0|nr:MULTISPECIES: hypothetical protein [unclassified Nesterenkonia]MBO0596270.1 hypothetical protein [Nesterenkonia sp. E16_10]MBO0597135.1 hypothetical protein [Nesterenkonia sp. E16_7]